MGYVENVLEFHLKMNKSKLRTKLVSTKLHDI